jgi:hypothetical protein
MEILRQPMQPANDSGTPYMVMIGARLIFFTACERVVVGAREVLEARDACERVVVGALDTVLIQYYGVGGRVARPRCCCRHSMGQFFNINLF